MVFSAEYRAFDEKRIADTIGVLRQMRYKGEVIQTKGLIGIQGVLADAERLAKSAGPYLVHFIAKEQAPEMLRGWEDTLEEMKEKYQPFPQVRRSPFGMPLIDMRTKLVSMTTNNLEGLTDVFIRGNYLADMDFPDLFDDTLGVLAPLSTDILAASLLPEFIRLRYSQKVPQVKPVLLSTDLKSCTLPRNESGEPVFATMTRVLAFVDLNAMGETRNALVKAAQVEYPNTLIPTSSPFKYRRY